MANQMTTEQAKKTQSKGQCESNSPWPEVSALRLAIDVRWARPTVIPGPLIANVLRGAVGLTFRKLVCPREWMNHECHPCPLYASCGYGQVFVPTSPAEGNRLRLQQDLPRPFVIEPPGLASEDFHAPDRLTFGVMLFGSSTEYLPFFITTLERLGREGMGRDRVPFDLVEVRSRHRLGDEVLLREKDATLRLPSRKITTEDLLAGGPPNAVSPGSVAPPRITLRFLTPTLLKTGSGISPNGQRLAAKEVRDRPELGVIVRRLRDRLSSLCAFFGEEWNHPDFASLGTAADRATLVESDTQWLSRTRHSTRTGQSYDLEGLVGTATYQFPDAAALETVWPLLRFGELIHVGKNAPWGNGGVEVQTI